MDLDKMPLNFAQECARMHPINFTALVDLCPTSLKQRARAFGEWILGYFNVVLHSNSGCEITEFPGFRDTQKHHCKLSSLTRVSDWTPCKNKVLESPKLPMDSPLPIRKPQRVSETQFLYVISHPSAPK